MKKILKKHKKINKSETENPEISFEEFKEIMSEFNENEINIIYDWLLSRQQKLSKQ
jgi:hypothetical protein